MSDEAWSSLRVAIDRLVLESAGGDKRLERLLRRKLENWAINEGSGKAAGLKSALRKKLFATQEGRCAKCKKLLEERYFDLHRIDHQFADDEDQGYRDGNVQAVHPHCNPRGPFPGGRGPS